MSKTKKLLIAAVCLVAILTSAVVGTIAWLTDKTATVTNTFSPSTVGLTLTETKGVGSSQTAKDFKMVPGTTIDKDPVVTVKANSEACWLFVKIEQTNGFDNFMAYAIASGWSEMTTVEGVTGVYYRQVAASAADQPFDILGAGAWTVNNSYTWAANQVLVRPNVTKEMMKAMYNDDGTVKTSAVPTMSFTAYAIQQEGFTDVAAAWAAASALANP